MTDIQPVLEGDLLTNQLHFISSMVGRRGRKEERATEISLALGPASQFCQSF